MTPPVTRIAFMNSPDKFRRILVLRAELPEFNSAKTVTAACGCGRTTRVVRSTTNRRIGITTNSLGFTAPMEDKNSQ